MFVHIQHMYFDFINIYIKRREDIQIIYTIIIILYYKYFIFIYSIKY